MIAAFRSEWVKLTRRNFAVGSLAALVGFSVAITSVSILRANDTGEHHGPMGRLTMAKLVAPGGWLSGLGAASTFLGLVTLAIFASNVAGEFTSGTIRSVLTVQPRRLAVFAGKSIALVSFVVGGLVIATAAVAGVAFPLASRQGIDTSSWTSSTALTEGLSTYANVLASCIAWGAFGAMLAVLTRSSAIAIAAGVGYFLLAEQLLLNNLWPSTEEYLPASAMSALAEGGNASVSFAPALGLVTGYVLGAYAIAALVFARRDITA